MRRISISVAIALSICVFAPTAGIGQITWQTIHAAGDPKITIDIPADVHQETSVDPKKGQVMAFFASESDNRDLMCFLFRFPYASKKMTAKRYASAMLQSIPTICSESGPTISRLTSMHTEATTSNGYPAASCASGYTKSDEKKPGMVETVMTFPTRKMVYNFTCKSSAEDQDNAEASWVALWHDAIAHMQSSLVLPDSEK